jgi:outer membrane lipoprotein-sorting protein
MKKLSSVLAALLVAAVAVVSCGKKQKPEQVAEKFLKHLAKAEFKEAKELATGDAEKWVSTLEAFSQMASQDKKEQKEADIEDMKCEVTGDSATCTYKQDDKDGKLFMKKVDGKWKVSNMPKENGGDMNMKDEVTEENDSTKTQHLPKAIIEEQTQQKK